MASLIDNFIGYYDGILLNITQTFNRFSLNLSKVIRAKAEKTWGPSGLLWIFWIPFKAQLSFAPLSTQYNNRYSRWVISHTLQLLHFLSRAVFFRESLMHISESFSTFGLLMSSKQCWCPISSRLFSRLDLAGYRQGWKMRFRGWVTIGARWLSPV